MTRHAKASSAKPAVRLGLWRGAPLTVFVLLVAVLALGAASAAAKEVHVLKRSFGQGELSLHSRSGVALNQESGEVYVADTGNSRVAKFTAAGLADGNLATIAEPTFIAVDNSSGSSNGDIYVVDAADNSITKLDALGLPVSGWGTGGHLAGLGEIAGIAVDSDGDLWAYNTESIMRKLSGSSGAQLTEWNSGRGVRPVGIAVDGAENIYMVAGGGAATQFSAAGNQIKTFFGPSQEVGALMGTESSGEVYFWAFGLNGERRIERLTSSEQLVESFPTGQSSEVGGLSIRASTDEVFAADSAADQISVFAFENVEPPTATIELPDTVTARTAHFVGHINPNAPSGNPSSYDVTWRFVCTPGCPGVEGQISADSSEHLVEGTAEGLQPHTHYEVTLVTKNAGGSVETETLGFTTLPDKPFAESGFTRSVTDTEATLNATIVPNGAATTYHFDYVPKSAYEAEGGFASPQTLSTPEQGLPPVDNARHAVSARITGLENHTAYVYRVVATNSAGSGSWPTQTEEEGGLAPSFITQSAPVAPETGCPNQAFREFTGASLPDCRAYEQASPRDKNGLNIEGLQDLLATSPDGSRVSFFSQAGTGIPASGGGYQDLTTLLSTRRGESWSTQRLLPPEELGNKAGFIGASQDLRYALVETSRRGAILPRNGLFIIDTTDFSIAQIVPYEEGNGGAEYGQYAYDSISADGSRVFFETINKLTGDAAAGLDNLYMWDRDTGEVSLVGVLPGASEETPAGGSFGGAYSWFFESDPSRGGALGGLYVEALHAISPDGDQAYFTAGETGQLYLRRGLTGPSPTTVHVSEPNAGVADPNGPLPATFQEATPDGSRAFLLSSQKLTVDATTGEFDEGKDLYRYDAETGTLVDITPDPGESEFNGARVRGLLGASADGSSGYFVARGELAEGGVSGENNIYRFSEEGGSFTLAFVATIAAEGDTRNWSAQSNESPYIVPQNSTAKTSRVAADGQTLVFSSRRSLTGYDNQGCLASEICRELFVYSAKDDSLNCVSCPATGERAIGDAQLSTGNLNGYLIPASLTEGRLTRSISADGSRIFFNSSDSLVPADTNGSVSCKLSIETPVNRGGTPACQDAYEWEAVGAPGGSCQKAEVNGGCLYLLSTGKSKEASYFIDASSDGSNAFIATSSQLVPTDKDELYDVYGVRTNGGLASQHVSPAVPCSSGEACHGSSSLAPETSSPGTSSFQGPGNPKSGKAKAKKCQKSARKSCSKKKKHQKKKNAKRPNATTRKAGGSK